MTQERIQRMLQTKEYSALREWASEQNEVDIAMTLCECTITDMMCFFRILPKALAAQVFSCLPIETATDLIASFELKEASQMMELMYADDAVDLLEEMPANVATRLLHNATSTTRATLNLLLQYPENSAGSIMTVEFVTLRQGLTIGQALEKIRSDHRTGNKAETINTCYVLDDHRHLLGVISLRDLVLSNPETSVSSVMEQNIISVVTTDDREMVALQFQKYGYSALPVTDSENRLVGIITSDDIIDVMQEEATEDMEIMAAILPSEKPYPKCSVLEIWKKRIPWLLLLMLSAAFTTAIISHFETALASQVLLIAFIPMLMGTGGNAGGQSSVSIIRSLSLHEIAPKDFFSIAGKELMIGILCGLSLGCANFIKMMMIDFHFNFETANVRLALVISITVLLCVIIAKLTGCFLPILAKRIGLDPAVIASPFITTITDVITLIIYFAIAFSLLPI